MTFKIDGYILEVKDLFIWVTGFIALYRKGKLKSAKLPKELLEIMKKHPHKEEDQDRDKELTKEIMKFLKENDEYMDAFIKLVK
ncbi:MAG: hypothetical protein ABIH66_02290, partial [bacterium]